MDHPDSFLQIEGFIRSCFLSEFELSVSNDRISEVEAKLGMNLSPGMKSWISFHESSSQLSSWFTYRDPVIIERRLDHKVTTVLYQGEDDRFWAIENANATSPDPTVLTFCPDYENGDEDTFVLEGVHAPTLSSFTLDYFFTYLSLPDFAECELSEIASSFSIGHIMVEIAENGFRYKASTSEYCSPIRSGVHRRVN